MNIQDEIKDEIKEAFTYSISECAEFSGTETDLIKQYGLCALNKAVKYFLSKDKHCVINELENKCKEYAGDRDIKRD